MIVVIQQKGPRAIRLLGIIALCLSVWISVPNDTVADEHRITDQSATPIVPTTAVIAPLKILTLEFPPLEFLNANGDVDGAATKIIRTAFQDLGLAVEIELLPWTRSLSLVREGKADAIFTAYRNPEREKFLDFSEEVLVPQVVSLYVKKGSTLGFRDFGDLKGKTVGIVSSISYGLAFDQARAGGTFRTERVEDLALNFRKLIAGRIDYVVSNRYSAQVVIDKEKIQPAIQELANPVEVTPSYLAFSKAKGLIDVRNRFDQALKKMKQSGRYDDILKEFNVRIPRELAGRN